MKILILQPMLKQYRVALYEKLVGHLQSTGHEVRLVFGSPPKSEKARKDNVLLEKPYCYYPKSYWLFNSKLHYLKGALRHVFWADFVVTEQANKHLFNYALIFLHAVKLKRIAYWGHGQNFQGDPGSLRERIKKFLAVHSDWWFAYTQGVADYITGLGYPTNQITVLNNAIDTQQFRDSLSALSGKEIAVFRKRFNLQDQHQIGLYCGSLYKERMIPFLLDTACELHKKIPNFILMVAGDGSEHKIVEEYARKYPFIHYLGAIFGQDKTLAFHCADIFLCPGPIGLAVLDAFAARLPVYSTMIDMHGPEVEYLTPGFNGRMTLPDIQDYSQVIIKDLADPNTVADLSCNAYATGLQYTMEGMVNNFSQGFAKWISAKPVNY